LKRRERKEKVEWKEKKKTRKENGKKIPNLKIYGEKYKTIYEVGLKIYLCKGNK
jgi:predicted peroxiredoxin